MTDQEFVDLCRAAQKTPGGTFHGRLVAAVRGCIMFVADCSGACNGNPRDIWILGASSGKKVLGRAYLGSRNMAQDLEGWPGRIASAEIA